MLSARLVSAYICTRKFPFPPKFLGNISGNKAFRAEIYYRKYAIMSEEIRVWAKSGRTLLGTPPAQLSPWPTPPTGALCLEGCWGISVHTATQLQVACVPVARIYHRHQNQWSYLRALLLPTGRCGAHQPLFYASRASQRLCLEGRYGSRSCGTAESTADCTSPSDSAQYLRMLVVGDIRARSYATGQQSLGDETTDLARRSDTECCVVVQDRLTMVTSL